MHRGRNRATHRQGKDDVQPGSNALSTLDFRQTTPPTYARFMIESRLVIVTWWLSLRRRYVRLKLRWLAIDIVASWHFTSIKPPGSANHRPIQVPLCRQHPSSDPRVLDSSLRLCILLQLLNCNFSFQRSDVQASIPLPLLHLTPAEK